MKHWSFPRSFKTSHLQEVLISVISTAGPPQSGGLGGSGGYGGDSGGGYRGDVVAAVLAAVVAAAVDMGKKRSILL